ncbi:MAG: hypothetical protein WBD67_08780 [Terracidiphilus sp.]
MTEQNRESVYQGALSNAQSELQQIQDEFDQIARRKDFLSQMIDALTPLLDLAQPAPAAATELAAAPVRFFDPTSFNQLQPQMEAIATFAQPAPEVAVQVEEPVMQAMVEETFEPRQEVFLQKAEEPQPEPQPVASGGSLEQRINFALNFALLS